MTEYIDKTRLVNALSDYVKEHRLASGQYREGYVDGVRDLLDAIRKAEPDSIVEEDSIKTIGKGEAKQ